MYASTKFFAALAAIPHYQRLPVYKAAQAVQHSADGSAYSQYEPQGAAMAGGFSGRLPHAVWCWYGGTIRGRAGSAPQRTRCAEPSEGCISGISQTPPFKFERARLVPAGRWLPGS